MYKNSLGTLESLNFSKNEILFTEPLHDIINNIKNLYQEIPYHVPKNKKRDVRQILDISFNGKDAKNSSDNLPQDFLNKILLTYFYSSKYLTTIPHYIPTCTNH